MTTTSQFHHLCTATASADWTFAFRGHFVEEITTALVDIGEGSSSIPDGTFKRKLSFMLVESFQNLLKHAESRMTLDEAIDDAGMFCFRKCGSHVLIHSINVIRNSGVPGYVDAIQKINSLDKDQLRELHVQHLQENQLSERGGAGLGLIEIARKSGNKIHHDIQTIDAEYSFLHQMIVIGEAMPPMEVVQRQSENAEFYWSLHRLKLMVFYKGDFNQRTILPIIELAELGTVQTSADAKLSLKALHVIVEMLQNVSRHQQDFSQVSYFAMGICEEGIQVFTSNLIEPFRVQVVRDKMKFLVHQTRAELAELHREALRASLHFESKTSSGLGLIEICQASKVPPTVDFFKDAEDRGWIVLKSVV
ncbi:MAG: SiaB family protein kinase [Flavobacteriales bacterium]